MTMQTHSTNQIQLRETVACQTVQALLNCGVREFCICPGGRAVEFSALLQELPALSVYSFYDERSSGFFALGRSQRSQSPVAVIVTSGTAPAHLLPAVMEAYYTNTPLIIISADRPRRFRGSNAPQTAEQVGLYGLYTKIALDLAEDEPCDLSAWDKQSPIQINVCLEEPNGKAFANELPKLPSSSILKKEWKRDPKADASLQAFLKNSSSPLVIVGGLKPQAREAVAHFLLKLQAPVFLEAISGLREDRSLGELQITRTDRLWEAATRSEYPIDAILRIGAVPTFRLWRDLEEKEGSIPVFSLSETPFSGLSWGKVTCAPLDLFFQDFDFSSKTSFKSPINWLNEDAAYQKTLQILFQEEPTAEASLVHVLSQHIPAHAFVYLGNSLPIREWDQAATFHPRHFEVRATRGLNGIECQTSTFLGLTCPGKENWGLLGDLTALHDLGGPWILKQLKHHQNTIVVINNGGGRIFARLFPDVDIQNKHQTAFKPWADLWEMAYERWHSIPPYKPVSKNRLIELIPDYSATQRLWKRMAQL